MKYLLNIDDNRISLWRKFKAKCSLDGDRMIDVIFKLIKSYVEER